jgi:hypothetical protein
MAEDIGPRVSAALNFLQAGEEDVRDHYLWQIRQVLGDLTPEDLSDEALVSLLAVLAPEHSRVLAARRPGSGKPRGRLLHLIPNIAAPIG